MRPTFDVTRFCEISPLWQIFNGLFLIWQMLSLLWQICDIIGLIFKVPNGQILKNNVTNWSHYPQLTNLSLIKHLLIHNFSSFCWQKKTDFARCHWLRSQPVTSYTKRDPTTTWRSSSCKIFLLGQFLILWSVWASEAAWAVPKELTVQKCHLVAIWKEKSICCHWELSPGRLRW